MGIDWLSIARAQDTARPKSAPASRPQPVATDSREQDIAAIEATLASFAEAFQAADAKALVSHWTAEGEYQNDGGLSLHGRDTLEARFAEFFKVAPDPKSEVSERSIRFLSKDTAIIEGKVAIRRGPAEPLSRARFSATLVRDQGRWRLRNFARRMTTSRRSKTLPG